MRASWMIVVGRGVVCPRSDVFGCGVLHYIALHCALLVGAGYVSMVSIPLAMLLTMSQLSLTAGGDARAVSGAGRIYGGRCALSLTFTGGVRWA